MKQIVFKRLGRIKILFALIAISQCLSVRSQCVAGFTYGYFQNGSIWFSNSSTGYPAGQTNFSWNFGDGNSSQQFSPVHTYSANGTYTVVLTIASWSFNPPCSSVYSLAISVNNNPCNQTITASFTGTAGLAGSYSVTSTSIGTTNTSQYTWLWGDNTTSTGPTASHTYSMNGWKNLMLAVTDGGCADTTAQQIFINNSNCTLTASFNQTVTQSIVNFQSTSTGTLPGATYWWSFGDGGSASGASPTHTYQSNGTYQVTMYVANPNGTNAPVCYTNTTNTVVITSCSVNAAYTFTYGPNGSLSVTSISTGTTNNAAYIWWWGDGNTGAGANAVHTYSSNGQYWVRLIVNDLCVDSLVQQVNITNSTCSLSPSFVFTLSQSGFANFVSTTTGTLPVTSYSWDYGDGGTGTGSVTSHQYSNFGNYMVILTAYNTGTAGPSCITNFYMNLNYNCNPSASFIYSVQPGGVVNFSSTSTGTVPGTSYSWTFGDGGTATGLFPSHTYSNGGPHPVFLYITNSPGCSDTAYVNVNVNSIPCTANSNFTVVYGGQPQYWLASPSYFGNVTNAIWYWGDGTSTNALYPSHTYSAAGWYNICLSVTVSCAQTSSSCANYNIYKLAAPSDLSMAMTTVNVVPFLVQGIKSITPETSEFVLFPNPSNGLLHLFFHTQDLQEGTAEIRIYDLMGSEVFHTSKGVQSNGMDENLNLETLFPGNYMMEFRVGDLTVYKRITIIR
jgi:PKD repeat protein